MTECYYCGEEVDDEEEFDGYCSMYCEISDNQGPEVDF